MRSRESDQSLSPFFWISSTGGKTILQLHKPFKINNLHRIPELIAPFSMHFWAFCANPKGKKGKKNATPEVELDSLNTSATDARSLSLYVRYVRAIDGYL